MTLRAVIAGASGRMGQVLLAQSYPGLQIVAALVLPSDPMVGQDISVILGGLPRNIQFYADLDELPQCDVIIEFTNPIGCLALAAWACEQQVQLVSGTTGFDVNQWQQLQHFAERISIVHGNNMSPGLNRCAQAVAEMAQRLGEVDVEIIESHHRYKVDAPSGTALFLGEAVAKAWGVSLADRAVYSRHGQTGARPSGAIGFAVIRAGDIVGEHRVLFASDGDQLEIVHRSSNRSHYAKGAMQAAIWLSARKPGLYTMTQVLGITS